MRKFIDLDRWEKEQEDKLSYIDRVINILFEDLGELAIFLDIESIKTDIQWESNYMDFDLNIPKDIISDEVDIDNVIKSLLGHYESRASGSTFHYTNTNVEDKGNLWNVHVNMHWGLDI